MSDKYQINVVDADGDREVEVQILDMMDHELANQLKTDVINRLRLYDGCSQLKEVSRFHKFTNRDGGPAGLREYCRLFGKRILTRAL